MCQDKAGEREGLTWKIIEAAETQFNTGPGDLALTIQWSDDKETLEHVSDHAARVLGYAYPDEDEPPPPLSPADKGNPDTQDPWFWAQQYRDEFAKRMMAEAEVRSLKVAALTPSAPIAAPARDDGAREAFERWFAKTSIGNGDRGQAECGFMAGFTAATSTQEGTR